MSFFNYPDIQDDGQGNVTIQKSNGQPANLNVTGIFAGTWFTFNNIQNHGNNTVLFRNKDGTTQVDIVVSGSASIYRNLNVTGNLSGTWFMFNNIQNNGGNTVLFKNKDGTTPTDVVVSGSASVYNGFTVTGITRLNGRTVVNSGDDNLPFQLFGAGGYFWFYTSGGQHNAAIIRGKQNALGLLFTGNDRVRLEGVAGDNRIATLQDLAGIVFMQNPGLMNATLATGFNG